ncbi:MAG: ACP S-malonyltransferase [Bacteroidetes bacterium]|nr:ACP S-malonyltransferase [Bacteroidota bacterium]
MKAYVFPGQGSQFVGMGLSLYEYNDAARAVFVRADEILGFGLSEVMFRGTEEDLRQTKVTQPAIFLHSIALVKAAGDLFQPSMAAGHSLGEFSALAACGALDWEDALRLVAARANAMQRACEMQPSTMAAILGLEDEIVNITCKEIDEVIVAANFNSPGQVVISGSVAGVNLACEALKAKGAKRAILLAVGGAFHSPLMEPAREELAAAIEKTNFQKPICPIYQNVTAMAVNDPSEIKQNLIAQLTAPVLWTQTITNMLLEGAHNYVEAGPGKVLSGLIKKIDRDALVESLEEALATA